MYKSKYNCNAHNSRRKYTNSRALGLSPFQTPQQAEQYYSQYQEYYQPNQQMPPFLDEQGQYGYGTQSFNEQTSPYYTYNINEQPDNQPYMQYQQYPQIPQQQFSQMPQQQYTQMPQQQFAQMPQQQFGQMPQQQFSQMPQQQFGQMPQQQFAQMPQQQFGQMPQQQYSPYQQQPQDYQYGQEPFPPMQPKSPGDAPSSPPPTTVPQTPSVQVVNPGSLRNCLYKNTYIWPKSGTPYWFFPLFVGNSSVSGYKWEGNNWAYFGTYISDIDSFSCPREN